MKITKLLRTAAYNYFKENAYEIPDSEDPDIPFTHLVL